MNSVLDQCENAVTPHVNFDHILQGVEEVEEIRVWQKTKLWHLLKWLRRAPAQRMQAYITVLHVPLLLTHSIVLKKILTLLVVF